ncbi:hypothetical protein BUALT_Bualt15G0004800 [Buddleja alternifolia]|uniref:Major facilitator superfamily (MFS) profile domain-containing protein n=1 Tax=Buddleja alternifolia TaxID=168488 RepID=A0AAV6WHX4_9LAMI|nr:hypothetical protein BUALT_Bualt15G0004800 [Buddleja alternifolia]
MMPLIGKLSDVYGRKAILQIPLTLAIIPLAILAWNRTTNFFYVHYVFKTLTGMVTGGGVICLSLAYLADNVCDRNRVSAFGILSGVFSAANLSSTLAARFLSIAQIFQVATAVSIVAVIYARVFLEETKQENSKYLDEPILRPDTDRNQVSSSKNNFTEDIPSPKDVIRLLRSSVMFSLVACVTLCDSLAEAGVQACLLVLFLLPALGPFIGEETLLVLAMFAGFVNMFIHSIAWSSWVVYASSSLSFFFALATPTLKALVSKHSAPNEQGIAQGSILGITSFANLISPLIYSPISALFLSEEAPFHFPGFGVLCIGFAYITGLGAVLMMPLIGKLSDVYGRKAILQIPLTLAIIPLVILAWKRTTNFFYAYYAFKILIAMITDSGVLCLSLGYLADNVSEGNRVSAFGVLSGVISAASVSGTLAARLLSTSQIFQVAAIISVVAVVYVRVFLEETTRDNPFLLEQPILGPNIESDQTSCESSKKINFIQEIPSPKDIIRLLRSSITFSLVACVTFFHSFAEAGAQTFLLYFLKARFQFKKDQFANILLINFGGGTLSNLIFQPVVGPFIGEKTLLIVAMFAGFVNMLIHSIAQSSWGIAQGSILGITSFANLISPLIYSPISALFLSEEAPFHFPGFSVLCIGFAYMSSWRRSVAAKMNARSPFTSPAANKLIRGCANDAFYWKIVVRMTPLRRFDSKPVSMLLLRSACLPAFLMYATLKLPCERLKLRIVTLTSMITDNGVLCLSLGYLADNVSEGDRVSAFGVMSGVLYAASVSGIFLEETTQKEPNLLEQPILKPTRESDQVSRESSKKTNFIEEIPSPKVIIRLLRSSIVFSLVACVSFCHSFADAGLQAAILYFLKAQFQFKKDQYADILLINFGASMISSFFFLPVVDPFIGEETLLVIAMFVGFLNNFLTSIAWSSWVLYASTSLGFFSSLANPISRSLVSKHNGANEQVILFNYISEYVAFEG